MDSVADWFLLYFGVCLAASAVVAWGALRLYRRRERRELDACKDDGSARRGPGGPE